jgi:hypothetical protein
MSRPRVRFPTRAGHSLRYAQEGRIPTPVHSAANYIGERGQQAEEYWADRSNHDQA